MAFEVKYRCEWKTTKNRLVRVDIEEDATISEITYLKTSGNSPLTIIYPNAEFDKLTGIRESKVEFSILNYNVTAIDFLTTADNQYKFKIYINDTLEWVGWLDNDQLQEPFKSTLTEIKLTANDGLELIKNKELADKNGDQVWSIETAKEFIVYCLHHTGLGLAFTTFINMYPAGEDQRDVELEYDAFHYANITSFTFLTGPRNFDDCYTVLSKIMESFGCMLFQARGEWYIVQTNDRIAGDLDGVRRFDDITTSLSLVDDASYQFEIGLYKDHKFINDDAVVSWEKPFKKVAMNYEFKMPPVFFRNSDLLDGTFVVPSSTASREVYTIDHWTELNGDTNIGVDIDTTTTAELRRYVFQIPTSPYGTVANQPWVRTTGYYINQNDRVSLSYETSEKNSGFLATSQVNYVILTNGVTTYRLTVDGKWIIPSSTTPGFGAGGVGYTWKAVEDRRFWKGYSVTAVDPAPISGELYLMLLATGNGQSASNEVRYKDIILSVKPYYNEKLSVSGYEQKSEQSAVIKNEYDNQIFISKSDNIGTQGAILTPTYAQLPSWKYYTEDDADAVPFHKYITRAYWKAVYRNYIKIEAAISNLYSDDRLISLLNTCTVAAIPDKEFMITTMRSDITNEKSEVTLIEIRSTSNTNDFDEIAAAERFRYLNVTQEVFNDIKEEKKPLDWRFGGISNIIQLIKRRKRRRYNNYG